jgi:hypothetical protein
LPPRFVIGTTASAISATVIGLRLPVRTFSIACFVLSLGAAAMGAPPWALTLLATSASPGRARTTVQRRFTFIGPAGSSPQPAVSVITSVGERVGNHPRLRGLP